MIKMDLPDELNTFIFSKLPESDWKNFALINKQNYKNYNDNKEYLIKEIKTQQQFNDACLKGNIESIKQAVARRLLVQDNRKFNLNWGLGGACKGGHKHLVDYLIKMGANDWDYGLYGACEGGNKHLIDYMINRGANDWSFGLYSACIGGHKNVVDYMIKMGADDWNRGLCGACIGGHKHLVDYMINKGANYWNRGLSGACFKGHKHLVQYMIEKGADKVKHFWENCKCYQ
jgi:hypothetical protein